MNFQREAYVPEPLIYQALSAFMEIYELMGKYVEYHDSQFHKSLYPPCHPCQKTARYILLQRGADFNQQSDPYVFAERSALRLSFPSL